MFTYSINGGTTGILESTGFSTPRFSGQIRKRRGHIGRMPYSLNGEMELLPKTTAIRNTRQELVLCHFNGSNGATSWTEVHGANCASTSPSALSTASPKFGSASVVCGPPAVDGDKDFTITPSIDCNLADQDWTIEFFIKTSTTGAFDLWFVGSIRIEYTAEMAGIMVNLEGGGSISGSGAGAYAGVWTHIALVRFGNRLLMFGAGIKIVDSESFSATSRVAHTDNLITARSLFSQPTSVGIDEMRITRGHAYYTANFTPPSAPFS